MAKTRHEYLEDNERWMEFRKELESRDVRIRWLWQAKSSPELKHPNIHCAAFYGSGVRADAPIAVIVDYCCGKPLGTNNGYAMYMERGNSITADIAAICKAAA